MDEHELTLAHEHFANYDTQQDLTPFYSTPYTMPSWQAPVTDTTTTTTHQNHNTYAQGQQQPIIQHGQHGQHGQHSQPSYHQPCSLFHGQHHTPTPTHPFQYADQVGTSRPQIPQQPWFRNQQPAHEQQQQQQQQQQVHGQGIMAQQYGDRVEYNDSALTSLPMAYMPPQQQQMAMTTPMTMPASSAGQQYVPFTTAMESYGPLSYYQNDLQHGLPSHSLDQPGLHQQHHFNAAPSPHFAHPALLGTSPTDYHDNISSSGSETDWHQVNIPGPAPRASFEPYRDATLTTAVNPSLTLHIRSDSDSSNTEMGVDLSSPNSFGSYDDVTFAATSSDSDRTLDFSTAPQAQAQAQAQALVRIGQQHPASGGQHQQQQQQQQQQHHTSPASSPDSSPTVASPTAASPTHRRKKETASNKTTAKPIAKTRHVPVSKKLAVGEKKVGGRRGPLRPDQRAQAGEIRKLRACLRCKFLKKTCDKGDVCAGCQPSHARLWQVPCTRVDIKDLGYFVKDWKADYERHVTLGFSVANIAGYSPIERQLFITHGFGYILPINAREIFVRDENVFNVDWVETYGETPQHFDVPTARLTTGVNGVSVQMLHEYLDRHIDDNFERFINQHFEGTPFLTEMLTTAHKYYQRTRSPTIRKALKLILAYNLTQHITIVEGLSEEEGAVGRIDDEESRYYGKTLAPVMINFHIKQSLAVMWRDLQRDVLEELAALYSSVYSGEKLKNWPTIFMLASVLLAVWEEIQFDSHYRQPDTETVKKFCDDMESVPVGVITGLFSAISQKLPALQEWDSTKHHQLLNSDPAICDALTEVRQHVLQYEDYLKSRQECKFDRSDFDSLSNKFLAKLVIRTN